MLTDHIANKPLELRIYQQKQNDFVRDSARRGNRRIISCMSTGAGKSPQIADLAKSALEKMKRVIIVLPRRSLVNQLSASFHEWGINHGIVMSGHRRFTMPRCQIISIDTYMSRVSAGRMDLIEADLLLIDEMHLQFTPKKLELFGKYPMVVAFSATPIAPKRQSLGMFYQDIIETISMQELMDQGWLAPLRYFAKPDIDLSGLDTDAGGDYRESQLGGVMDKPQLVGDIFENWKRIAEGKPTVIFASSQAHARHLCDEFCSHGYQFEYVDCTYPDDQRQALFESVRNGKTIGIVNVGIVSVGIDIPCLECVVLARPTKLVSVYLQCVGRVTRLFPNKSTGIVIDHAGIIEALGLPTQHFEWSLDGKETVEERSKKKNEERKEPKQITCGDCGTVFQLRRSCPNCGFEVIKAGEPIPVHQADLKEVKAPKPADKSRWYAELLGYARATGKTDKYALALFRQKFSEWPHKKHGVQPSSPSEDVLGFIKHSQIRYAKSRGAA
jgi:DNA repair protein RadD